MTVTVTEKPWKDKVCIMIAKVYEKTVQLDEPLGDRKVVGSDGKAIPLGSRRCPSRPAATSAGPGSGRAGPGHAKAASPSEGAAAFVLYGCQLPAGAS